MTIEEFAAASLEMPDSFYTSSDKAYVTHGVVAGITRDSDVLDQSNWSVWLREMGITQTPNVRAATGNPCGLGTHTHDYVEPDEDNAFVMTSSHWACGWVDTLMVRVYLNPEHTGDEADEEEVYTPEFLKAYELREQLANYPVLDEEDYSERETQDTYDTLVSCYHVPEENAWAAVSYLNEYHDVCRGDDIRDSAVYEWYTTTDLEAPDWLASNYKAGQE